MLGVWRVDGDMLRQGTTPPARPPPLPAQLRTPRPPRAARAERPRLAPEPTRQLPGRQSAGRDVLARDPRVRPVRLGEPLLQRHKREDVVVRRIALGRAGRRPAVRSGVVARRARAGWRVSTRYGARGRREVPQGPVLEVAARG